MEICEESGYGEPTRPTYIMEESWRILTESERQALARIVNSARQNTFSKEILSALAEQLDSSRGSPGATLDI